MCHDFAVVQGQQPARDIHAGDAAQFRIPATGTLATPVTSNHTLNAGTSTPPPAHKWVRIAWLQGNSVQLCPVNDVAQPRCVA